MNCEHSNTTATPDKLEKFYFLGEKIEWITEKLDIVREKGKLKITNL